MKQRMPISMARKLGFKNGKKGAWTPEVVGTVVGVYDDLSWEPYRITDRDRAEYLKGYAAAISTAIRQQVWLDFFHSAGNGHDAYRVTAGYPMIRRLPRKVRRLKATKKNRRKVRAMAHFRWMDAEGKAVRAVVGRGFTEVGCRIVVLSFGASRWLPKYANGKSRKDAVTAVLAGGGQ